MGKRKSSNIKILYHQVKPGLDCPDGIFSALVAQLAYPTSQRIGCCYQSDLPEVNDGDKLIIVDFSFSIEVLNAWRDRACEIVLVDHHKTLVDKVHEYATAELTRLLGTYLQSLREQSAVTSQLSQGVSNSLIDSVFNAGIEKRLVLEQPVFRDFLEFCRFTNFFKSIKSLPVWIKSGCNLADVLIINFRDDQIRGSLPQMYLHIHTLVSEQIDRFLHSCDVRLLFKHFSQGDLSFDLNKCGAVLTWEYFFPDKPVPAFLLYAQDRDLWKWRLPHSKEINEAFTHIGRTKKVFDDLLPLTQDQLIHRLYDLGDALLTPKLAKARQLATGAEWRDICGYQVLVVELDSLEAYHYNDVMEYLYTEHPESLFVASYIKLKDGSGYKFSFRSAQGSDCFDVSKLAERFGGGGHLAAAGARMTTLPWESPGEMLPRESLIGL